MNNNQYNLKFEKLVAELELGELNSKPKAISGGLLHRMYAIETTHAKYAVKALNPQIMSRPTAMQNYIQSEKIANVAANFIHAQPAKVINGSSMQILEHQCYLIFDWIDGKSLELHEVTETHCEHMGMILAEIHKTDFSQLHIPDLQLDDSKETDWNDYLNKGQTENSDWTILLADNIQKLYEWSAQAKNASVILASDAVISHRDLEPKNVMWQQDNPIIIDWESAGYINPMHDLLETAMYWSMDQTGNVGKERFLAFINGYRSRVGNLNANWRRVLENGFSGKLDWLEYSLKRSLWIECTDGEEQQLGTSQVTWTIEALKQYEDMISDVENWLSS
ncbi:aminoglycoside phosphotransferase family protein [Paenibacillus taichungensis]|uniref:Aminoglycoside phosphotransferase family protein n=1 Tax=Paenibacillus taichungensis TaxID=484184 RepID=A0ABX2MX08_9BACL|nr:aminoglycoside phosphotransferase family protein [Paenibacillus taichungensis]NUU58540.1 aminoglycoside phosphotransferase family protein [Paenibacillus taichungensis]